MGEFNDAVEAYKKAISIKADYAEAYNNMGNAYKNAYEFDHAVAAYKQALLIQPGQFQTIENLIELLKLYSPQCVDNSLITLDVKIKRIDQKSFLQKENEVLSGIVIGVLTDVYQINPELKTNLSQIYKKSEVSLNCTRHMKIHQTAGIISSFALVVTKCK